jgi:hypothetical protein
LSASDRAALVPIADKLLLSPAEAAGLCSMGRDRALALAHLGEARGGWRAVKVGGRFYIPAAWLRDWCARLQDGTEVAV